MWHVNMNKLKILILVIILLWGFGFWYVLLSHNDDTMIKKLDNSEKRIQELEFLNKENEKIIKNLKYSKIVVIINI